MTAISVEGFKSFAERQRVEIGPLTLLAGANSSGKSSLVQPLLLLKQTLEASYDPGTLLLDGPHVRFSSADQLLTRLAGRTVAEFRVGFETDRRYSIFQVFRRNESQSFDLIQSDLKISGREVLLRADAKNLQTDAVEDLSPAFFGALANMYPDGLRWEVARRRCFLSVAMLGNDDDWIEPTPERIFGGLLHRIIHVPGLRGNPERSYNTSAVGDSFPGTFEYYVASIIVAWKKSSDIRLASLGRALQCLGLTWKIEANALDATRVELLVGRLPKKTRASGGGDLVNIADVGLGVSQVLPVLVALLTAEPGQFVYIEQPELHLHPQAQQALAPILAEAAGRGVRVVTETHSSILLLAIQALVAEGKLAPDIVKLHWFQRDSRGATRVTSGDLDQRGAYGDWPVDFGEVQAMVRDRYLDAVETKFFSTKKNA